MQSLPFKLRIQWKTPFTQAFFHRTSVWNVIWPSKGKLSEVKIKTTAFALMEFTHSSRQLSSVAQSCLTLCNPMDCSMPGFPVHYQHPNLAQLMSIKSVMPSNHLIFCCPLLLPPSIFPTIRIFSSDSALHIKCPKYWSFNFSISPSNEYSGLIPLGLAGLISLQSKGLSRIFSNTTVQKHQLMADFSPALLRKVV